MRIELTQESRPTIVMSGTKDSALEMIGVYATAHFHNHIMVAVDGKVMFQGTGRALLESSRLIDWAQ